MSAIKKKNRNCFVAKLSQTEEGSWEPLFFFLRQGDNTRIWFAYWWGATPYDARDVTALVNYLMQVVKRNLYRLERIIKGAKIYIFFCSA